MKKPPGGIDKGAKIFNPGIGSALSSFTGFNCNLLALHRLIYRFINSSFILIEIRLIV
jgi:hypothetical protein